MRPGVSVVIPVFNGARTIDACLAAVAGQTYDGPFEIIVVDNGSEDDSVSRVRGVARVRALTCRTIGAAAARNAGVKAARYGLIAFTDSDCRPVPEWLSALVDGLRPELSGVGGPIETEDTSEIARFVASISFNQLDNVQGRPPYLATANALFRKEALDRIGGFDETFEIAGGEDNDLGWRLHALGYELGFVSAARVVHRHPARLMEFVSQRIRYGYGEMLLLRKHHASEDARVVLRPGYMWKKWIGLCLHAWRVLGTYRRRLDAGSLITVLSDVGYYCGYLLARAHGVTRPPVHHALSSTKGSTSAERSSNAGTAEPMCLKPWTSFELDDQRGNVLPCCWTKKIVGNVQEQSLDDVWNGAGFVEFRAKMLAGEYEDICPADCPHRVGALHETLPATGTSPAFRDNLELLRRDIGERRTTLRARPISMRLLPSIRCNLQCIMCWQRVETDNELPARFYDEVEAVLAGVRTLILQGGEPLLIPRCRELLSRGTTREFPDLEVGMITNGTLLSEDFLKLIAEVNVRWLFVSLDAATPETYKRIRGANLTKVLENVARVRAARPDIEMVTGFVVMNENVHELADFIRQAERLGVDYEFSPVNAAFKKGDDFGSEQFRARLTGFAAEADAYIAARGLVNQSLETIKQRMWHRQFTSFRQRPRQRAPLPLAVSAASRT